MCECTDQKQLAVLYILHPRRSTLVLESTTEKGLERQIVFFKKKRQKSTGQKGVAVVSFTIQSAGIYNTSL